MMRKTVESKELEKAYEAENVFQVLKSIQQQLEKEIVSKQRTIERQEEELLQFRSQLEQKSEEAATLADRLLECQKNAEGSRQLINKLLNDINRQQQDLEWYRRTYEDRSLAGVIKDKLKHFFS